MSRVSLIGWNRTSRVMLALGGTCSWWAQSIHRRQRAVDIEVLWRSLVAKAETMDEARVAWDVFISQEGQAHWHCPCGQPISELFKTITVTVTL